MSSLSDDIARFIEELVRLQKGPVVIRRSRLAEQFGCAPSQITYVLETRFSLRAGYRVLSRRGGAGYIRIEPLALPRGEGILEELWDQVGNRLSEAKARQLLRWLQREGFLGEKEGTIMEAALQRQVLALSQPWRDEIRARLFKAMVAAAWSGSRGDGGKEEQP
ncbi:MAG: CtsR family transcriptional regulator [Bacillota bacterium]|nr:CtsR family transcriptional regulator [Bacillota bacterium]